MSAADALLGFWVHTLHVETYLGIKGTGEPIFDSSVAVVGFLEQRRRLVRGASGDQVVSESTFYTDRPKAGLFRAGSLVTLPGDVTTTVITSAVSDSGPLDLPDHVAISLT